MSAEWISSLRICYRVKNIVIFSLNTNNLLKVTQGFQSSRDQGYRAFPQQEDKPLLPPVIRYFHIINNTPSLTPKILHILCFSLLLGINAVLREIGMLIQFSFSGWGHFANMCKWQMEQFCSLIKTRLRITANVITDEGIRITFVNLLMLKNIYILLSTVRVIL